MNIKGIVLIASLCITKTFCQDGEGLGDQFQPSVKASCVGGQMTIRVDTKQPFEGIIHGPNRTEPGCSVYGRGGLKTYLRIDLTKTNGEMGSCGVKYVQRSEERKVAIAVRAHPTIELLEDRLYVVSCGKAGFQNSRNEVSVVQLKVTLPYTQEQKVATVLKGNRYNLRAEIVDHDPAFGFLVRRCFAFDNTDSTIQLVDDRGCHVENLISDFSYDYSAGTADATIYSMFTLPSSNRTYFQCDVAICRGECVRPKCSGATAAGAGQLTSLEEIDPFSQAEADAVTTSTSVFVAVPGSIEAAGAVYCDVLGGGDYNWLKWLCIAFGVLFAIMLLINIFLCSAMTCSCTKSEIIEKEPSIYDDYSIYDSQYGYTNTGAKVYGSESDYGSEYGIEGGDRSPPSESGTYHSKYSAHGGPPGSTLSRSRRH